MKGVMNMIPDDTVLAKDGSVIAVEAAVHGLIYRDALGIRRWALDGNGGSSLTGEHGLLGRIRYVQERLQAVADRLYDGSQRRQLESGTHILTIVLLTLAFFTGGVSAGFSSLRSKGRRSAPVGVETVGAAPDNDTAMPEGWEDVG